MKFNIKKIALSCFLVVSIMIFTAISALAFDLNATYSDFDFDGVIPEGLSNLDPASYDKIVTQGYDAQIYIVGDAILENTSYVLLYLGADATKIVPHIYWNSVLANAVYTKTGTSVLWGLGINATYGNITFPCTLYNDKYCDTLGTLGGSSGVINSALGALMMPMNILYQFIRLSALLGQKTQIQRLVAKQLQKILLVEHDYIPVVYTAIF